MCRPDTDAPPYPTPDEPDPTAAEDARINARTPRDDRNEPEE